MWIITFYVVNEVVIYIYIHTHTHTHTHTHVSIRIQIHIHICMHLTLTQLSLSLSSFFLNFFSLSFPAPSRFTLVSFSVSYLSTCLLSPCSWRRLLVEDRFCFVLKRARTHPNYVLYHVKNGNKVVDQFLFLILRVCIFPTDPYREVPSIRALHVVSIHTPCY